MQLTVGGAAVGLGRPDTPEGPPSGFEDLRLRELLKHSLRSELSDFRDGSLCLAFADLRQHIREDLREELASLRIDSPADRSLQSVRTTGSTNSLLSKPGDGFHKEGGGEAKHFSKTSAFLDAQTSCAQPDMSLAKPSAAHVFACDDFDEVVRDLNGCGGDAVELYRHNGRDEILRRGDVFGPPSPPELGNCITGCIGVVSRVCPGGGANKRKAPALPLDWDEQIHDLDDLGHPFRVARGTPLDDTISLEGSTKTSPRLAGPVRALPSPTQSPPSPTVSPPSPTASPPPDPYSNAGASSYFVEAFSKGTFLGHPTTKSRDSKFQEKVDIQRENLREHFEADRFSLYQPAIDFLYGRNTLADVVGSALFDNLSGIVILVNAVTIGIQTDYMARNTAERVPDSMEVIDKVIAVIFAVELMMRLCAFRCAFFTMPGWKWNVFDFTMVAMQVLEELVRTVVVFGDTSALGNFKIMRVLRVLRLIRIVRVVRIMRMVSDLRTIVASVMGSLKALLWTVVLLMIFMYMVAVYFTQTVTDYKVAQGAAYPTVFDDYYNSVFKTFVGLYMAISGGMDWSDMADPLFEHLSPGVGVIFVFYVAFSLLCILNVVTGVFVESALKNAQQEENLFMERNLTKIFQSTDLDNNGTLDWEEFEAAVQTEEMQEFMRSINLEPDEAITLFKLVDVEERGQVMMEEFVIQCSRLRGQARSIDLMTVLFEMRHFVRSFLQHSQGIDKRLTSCESMLKQSPLLAIRRDRPSEKF